MVSRRVSSGASTITGWSNSTARGLGSGQVLHSGSHPDGTDQSSDDRALVTSPTTRSGLASLARTYPRVSDHRDRSPDALGTGRSACRMR